MAKPDAQPDPWLDADTYRFSAPQDQVALLRAVTTSDVQRVANRFFKFAPVASVVAGDPLQLKPAFEGRVKYEVLGEVVSSSNADAKTTRKTSE